jgi:molybdopterin converting factor small subunit
VLIEGRLRTRGPRHSAGLRCLATTIGKAADTVKDPSVAETNLIRVRYWASAKAAAGTDADDIAVDGGITLAELRRAAAALHPDTRLAEVLAACSTLVGDQPVGKADPTTFIIDPGAEVEFLPPFAGG